MSDVLSSASRSLGLSLLLWLPIFDGGRHKAEVARRKAELDMASTAYRETLLQSLREVYNALSRLSGQREKLALANSDFDLRQGGQQFASDLISRSTLLEANQKLLAARATVVEARFETVDATLELIRSLGGGW